MAAASGFRSVGWAAAIGSAALGCYMLSLSVAVERNEVAQLERSIIIAKQEIRSLQTELGTRGRMSQLEQWNAEILALSAPTSQQYLKDEVMLARFDRREQTIEDKARVQLASAEVKVKPAPALKPGDYAAAAAANAAEPAPTVHRASLATAGPAPLVRKASLPIAEAARKPALAAVEPVRKPVPAPKKAQSGLLDSSTLSAISDAARSEAKAGAGARR